MGLPQLVHIAKDSAAVFSDIKFISAASCKYRPIYMLYAFFSQVYYLSKTKILF